MRLNLAHIFTPHQSNNHRPRIIQNAGFTLLIAIFLFSQATIKLLSVSGGVGGFVLGYASSITPGQVIELTNQERSKYGLPSLTHNGTLSSAAASKANHMFAQQYWAHIAPDGTSPWFFIKNAGYSYSVAGENLARDFGDTGSVIVAWMNSPTHKDNIVNAKYQEMGVAVVDGVLNGVETTLVVQMFGSQNRVAAATTPKAATTPAPAPEVKSITQEEPQIEPVEEAVEEVEEIEFIESPDPEPIATAETLSAPAEGAKVRISPLTITKTISTSIIALIILVLAYDVFVINRKKLLRIVGKNWAHFGFFGIILVIIYISTAGQII
ncbi:CAP domain-containing protein [Patescibacteria group bacterium]